MTMQWLRLRDNEKTLCLINNDRIRKIEVFRNKDNEVDNGKTTIWYVDGGYDVFDIPLSEIEKALFS